VTMKRLYHGLPASSTPHRPVDSHPHPPLSSLSNGSFGDQENAFSYTIELNQQDYEKLVALALDDWRPPSWHMEWMVKKAIQEAYAAAYPAREAPVGVGPHGQEQ
jgi:hypothetical protein